jgi:hypothetical protein
VVVVVGRIDFVADVMVGGGWECDIVAEIVAVDDEGCGCVAEVEGWRWYDAVFDWEEALASVRAGEGCRHCTIALQALLALCWCAIFELWHAELLLASSWWILVLGGASQFLAGLWHFVGWFV